MQTFVDPASPRFQLPFEQLPRGVVKFPPQVVAAISLERGKFAPGVFTEEYARKSLEQHTLTWYYAGLPVAYKPLPDGIEVLGVGWEETAEHSRGSAEPAVRVVQP